MPPSDATVPNVAINFPAVAFSPSVSYASQSASSHDEHREPRATSSPPEMSLATDDGLPTSPEPEAGASSFATDNATPLSTHDVGAGVESLPPGLATLRGRSPPVSPVSSGPTSLSEEADIERGAVQDMDVGSHRTSEPTQEQPRSSSLMRSLGVQTQITVIKRGESVSITSYLRGYGSH